MSTINDLFKALSHENRREMLVLLKKGELTTLEMATHFEMSKMGVAKHLRILKNAGLINSYNKGQYLYYSLNPIVFRDVSKWIDQFYSESKS
ncbi:metalloregulator ArsR/SmtB family transcription factor [Ferdinandcohnia sp. SAFN-114]|uniref:metalloregulator ArsR/SmtB family transcription factor n=1 Tax=Ferdinandcohnia sp. SAFN-114 TaxID=3387275 RepID=UPI003F7DB3EA